MFEQYLAQASIMQLAINDHATAPYIVAVHPLYYEGALYFYSANTGRKLDLIKTDPVVGFAINDFNNNIYRSVTGTANTSFVTAGKQEIIKLLLKKYNTIANINAIEGLDFSDDILLAVAVIKLEIISVSFRIDRR